MFVKVNMLLPQQTESSH